MDRFNNVVQKIVMPMLLAVTTTLGIYTTVLTNKQEMILNKLSAVEKQLAISQKDLEFVRQFKFQLYNEVKAAIASKDASLQRTAYEFVFQMLSDPGDEKFRDALLKTLKNSPTVAPSIKKEIRDNLQNKQQFNADETRHGFDYKKGKYIIDVFYLEESQDVSRGVAEAFAKNLGTSTASVRVRILPKLVNSREGYQIVNNEIRYEPSDEKTARNLERIAIDKMNLPVTRKEVAYRTPNYISVFIKDGPSGNSSATETGQ